MPPLPVNDLSTPPISLWLPIKPGSSLPTATDTSAWYVQTLHATFLRWYLYVSLLRGFLDPLDPKRLFLLATTVLDRYLLTKIKDALWKTTKFNFDHFRWSKIRKQSCIIKSHREKKHCIIHFKTNNICVDKLLNSARSTHGPFRHYGYEPFCNRVNTMLPALPGCTVIYREVQSATTCEVLGMLLKIYVLKTIIDCAIGFLEKIIFISTNECIV